MVEATTPPLEGPSIIVTESRSWADEFRALLALGWPLIVAQLAQNALFTTDVIMIGWLGSDALAASTLASAVIICVQLLGIGIVGAVAPLVAQARGAGDIKSVRRVVRQGLWVSIALAVVLTPVIYNLSPILIALGQDPVLVARAEPFAHTACWLLLPAFGIMVLRSFLSAHGATRAILVITVVGVFVNALCNYALIFGHFGLPRLELAGSGISTTTVNLVMFLLMLGYVLRHKRFRRFHILARFGEADWHHFRQIFRIGAPIGLMLLAEVGLFTFASLMQGWIGARSVAAHAVALQLASLAFMVPLGLSQATTVRVGLAYGQGSARGIRLAGWVSLAATLGFMSCTCVIFLLFPTQLAGLFLDRSVAGNAEAITLAAQFLTVAGIFQLADGAQASASSALRGLSDTTMPLVLALLGYWAVGFPVAYLCGFVLQLGGIGIWYGLAIGLAVAALSLVTRFALRERLGLVPGSTLAQ